jgi:hypothetical protein
MAKEHKGLIFAPFEVEADLRAHPILGRTRIVPHHQARIGVDHFEPILPKLERPASEASPCVSREHQFLMPSAVVTVSNTRAGSAAIPTR